ALARARRLDLARVRAPLRRGSELHDVVVERELDRPARGPRLPAWACDRALLLRLRGDGIPRRPDLRLARPRRRHTPGLPRRRRGRDRELRRRRTPPPD